MTFNYKKTSSSKLPGARQGEQILADGFKENVENPEAELAAFLALLPKFKLPFANYFDQIRCLEIPGYPTFECGLPASYYYFIPNTRWGSDKPIPPDPLSPDFVYSTDGFGLNFGCPFKLKRALEVLDQLGKSERNECERNLALSHQHLATVEELLWLDVWKDPKGIGRSEGEPGMTYDWKLTLNEMLIRLECKFRPVDWARVADGDVFEPMKGFLLSKATKQLPTQPQERSINVVGVTGMGGVNAKFRQTVADELSNAPHVHALVYRNLTNEAVVFSLSEIKLQSVCALIAPQPAIPFQPFYRVIRSISESNRRQKARESTASSPEPTRATRLFVSQIKTLAARKRYRIPQLPYRFGITGRLPTGEPQLTVIPPLI